MFLGGLGLFMYGVQTTSAALQKIAANRLKEILQSLTKKNYLAVILGIVITVAFQSSAATTVLVVEFVNAGMMNLAQALGIVLGSAVGTSLSIQLIAFKMLDIALGLIFIGFVFYIFARVSQWKHLGQLLIGFGLIFVGMAYMSEASAPLRNIPELYGFLVHLGENPLLAILFGLIFTAFIQSSPAVFAIMMSFANQRILSMEAIVPLVLGAHIGGTVTTLFSSLAAQKMDARRAAVANTGYKVVGTVLVYPFLDQFARIVIWTTGDLQRQVANAHLLFALFMVVVFLPFNSLVAKLLVRLMPGTGRNRKGLEFKYIDESSLEVPAVALAQVFQEIRGLGELIRNNLLQAIPQALLSPKPDILDQIGQIDKELSWYYHHISRFLMTLSMKGLTGEQMEENLHAQFILKEFQYIADTMSDMVKVIYRLRQQNPSKFREDWQELKELYEGVYGNYVRMLEALQTWNYELAGQVIREHPEILRLQRALQFEFLARASGPGDGPDFPEEGKIEPTNLDFINLLYRIDEHTVNIAQVVMGIV